MPRAWALTAGVFAAMETVPTDGFFLERARDRRRRGAGERASSSGSGIAAMGTQSRPRVLCVDDEPNVLEGLTLHLRRRYDVVTAPGGAAALDLLQRDGETAVVISDMRMPGMDGAKFLGRARQVVPDAVRILLTGQADIQSAIAAVNDGQIFRFLSKPCPPAALLAAVDAAAEQNRLVTAERVLLEQTLHGSIKALTEALSLTSPVAFGRAMRIKQHVTDLAEKLEVRDRWQVEVAAMLSQLGYITLPPETLEKVYYGRPLSEAEQKMVARVPAVTEQLLANIPRLEGVRSMLSSVGKPHGRIAARDEAERQLLEQGTAMLCVALDLNALEARGYEPGLAIGAMRGNAGRYAPAVFAALVALRGDGTPRQEVRDLTLSSLRPGMVFADDVKTSAGTLFVARGYEVTASFVERVRNMRAGTVKEPVRVIVGVPSNSKLQPS